MVKRENTWLKEKLFKLPFTCWPQMFFKRSKSNGYAFKIYLSLAPVVSDSVHSKAMIVLPFIVYFCSHVVLSFLCDIDLVRIALSSFEIISLQKLL